MGESNTVSELNATATNDKLGRAEIDYSVSRLINNTGIAGGTTLPPRLQAGIRVPIVSNLRVASVVDFFGSTKITLTWVDAQQSYRAIAGYNVYYKNLSDANSQPQGPFFTRGSPATVLLTTNEDTVVILTVQTVLNSGQTSDLDVSPSVSVGVTAAAIAPSDLGDKSVTLAKIADQSVGRLLTWDASGNASLISAGDTNHLLTGNGTGSVASFKTFSTLDIVVGRSNLTTTNALAYISASGTLDDATNATWDNTNKYVTFTQPTPDTPVVRLRTVTSGDYPTEYVYQNRVATTNALGVTIQTLTVPSNTTMGFTGSVVARRTGGSSGTTGDSAFYTFSGAYKDISGIALVASTAPSVTVVAEDQAAWDLVFTISDPYVLIGVQGAANNNISWHITTRVYFISS